MEPHRKERSGRPPGIFRVPDISLILCPRQARAIKPGGIQRFEDSRQRRSGQVRSFPAGGSAAR